MNATNLSAKNKALAAEAFKDYPETDHVYVTSDGNVFLPKARGFADHHARTNRLPEPLKVERSQVEEKADAAKGKAGAEQAAKEQAEAEKAAAEQSAKKKGKGGK